MKLYKSLFAAALCGSVAIVLGCGTKDVSDQPPTAASDAVAAPSALSPGSTAASPPLHATGAASAAVVRPSVTVPATPKPTKPTRYTALSDEVITKEITPQLKDGETLAHAVFRGPFGPSQQTTVVITQHEEKGITQFGGFLLYQRDGKQQRTALPAFHEHWNGEEVKAIAFVPEADGDKVEELVVIASYITGIGKDGARPFHATTVIDVSGADVTRLREMERLAGTAGSVGAVRKAFAEATFILRLDGARQLIAPTLDRESAAARLSKLLGVAPEVDNAERVVFKYGKKDGDEGLGCTLLFDAQAKLTRIEVAAPSAARNGSLTALRARLRKQGVKPESKAGVDVWKYHGWRFEGHVGNKEAPASKLVITR